MLTWADLTTIFGFKQVFGPEDHAYQHAGRPDDVFGVLQPMFVSRPRYGVFVPTQTPSSQLFVDGMSKCKPDHLRQELRPVSMLVVQCTERSFAANSERISFRLSLVYFVSTRSLLRISVVALPPRRIFIISGTPHAIRFVSNGS